MVNGGKLNLDYSKYEKYFNTSETYASSKVPSVEDTYEIELKKKMKSDIEDMGYIVNRIDAELDLDKGVVISAKLSITKGQVKKDESSNDKNINVSIDKVEIGNKKIDNNLSDEDIESIKNKIKEDYGVDYKNISINSK